MSTELCAFHVSDPVAEWCPRCHRSTLNRASVYALTSTGPLRIGEWAVCEACAYTPYANPGDAS